MIKERAAVGGEERGNSWPSLECSEFERRWEGDINSPQPQAFTL